MKKPNLKPDSPEFRDLVKSTIGLKLSLPSLKSNNKSSHTLNTRNLPPLTEALKTLPKVSSKGNKLTGMKDTDREILKNLDDKDLLRTCSIDKRMWNEVCDENFLKRRLLGKYPDFEKYKLEKESWRQFFLRYVYYISKMKEDFQFDYMGGDFKDQHKIFKDFKDINKVLFAASLAGHLHLVKFALNKGANIESNGGALSRASERGHLEVVKYLIQRGANVLGVKSRFGGDNSPLTKASENGYIEIVKYLVEHGASVRKAFSALSNASEGGHYEVVKFLVENGADIDRYGQDSLIAAAKNGYLRVVKYLVEKGVDIHAQQDFALRLASEYGHLPVVKYLVEKGANIHVEKDQTLIRAASAGHLDVVKYLVEQGANFRAQQGLARERAYEHGHSDVVEYLKSLI